MFLKNKYKAENIQLKEEIINFTHFIRTPLSSIKMGSEILQELLPELMNRSKNPFGEQECTHNQSVGDAHLAKLNSVIENILKEANRISEQTRKIENRALSSSEEK